MKNRQRDRLYSLVCVGKGCDKENLKNPVSYPYTSVQRRPSRSSMIQAADFIEVSIAFIQPSTKKIRQTFLRHIKLQDCTVSKPRRLQCE